ncbi:MAG: DUF4129 domain-containing protein [Rhodospirillales bacterium]
MNPDGFADAARQVLSDPAYQTAFPAAALPEPPDEPPEWLAELLRRLADSMRWLFESVPGIDMSGTGDGLQAVLFLLLAVILAAGLFLLVRWLAPKLALRPAGKPGEVQAEQPQIAPHRLLASARQALADGNLDLAAGYLLDAVLAAIADRTGQRHREADTARQILSKLRAEASTLDLLRALVTLRERVHYAGRPPAQADLDSMLVRSEAIIDGGTAS